jgi:hypothetical protein
VFRLMFQHFVENDTNEHGATALTRILNFHLLRDGTSIANSVYKCVNPQTTEEGGTKVRAAIRSATSRVTADTA